MVTSNITPTVKRGRLSVSANALLVCVVVLRYLTVGYFIVGLVVKVHEGLIKDSMIDALDQIWISGLPLGKVTNSLVLTLICLLPVYFLSGFLGILGGFCRNKLLLYIHVLSSLIFILADIVFLVFFGMILANHNNGHLRNEFKTLWDKFENGRFGSKVSTSIRELLSSLQCCGVSGSSNNNSVCAAYTSSQMGCYDRFGSLLDQYLKSYIAMLCISFVFEVGCIIFSDAVYRQMQNHEILQQKQREYNQQQSDQDGGTTTSNGEAIDISNSRTALIAKTAAENSGCKGMCFDLFTFIISSCKRNTANSFIVGVKIFLLVLGCALVIHGVVFYYSDVTYNTTLNDIFDYLYFSGYQFRDILRGIAISSVTFGTLTMTVSIFGLINTCFEDKSKTAIYAGSLLFLIVAKIIAICLWAPIFSEMLWKMYDELLEQFRGFTSSTYNNFVSWNFMFTLFSCCGLRYSGDFEDSGFSVSSSWPKSCCKYVDTRSDNELFYFTSSKSSEVWEQGCVSSILTVIKTVSGVLVAILLLILILEIILFIHCYKRFMSISGSSNDSKTTEGMLTVLRNKLRLSDGRQKLIVSYWICHIFHMLFGLTFMIIGISCIYDKVFHHWKINDLLSKLSFSGHNFPYLLLCFTSVLISIGVLAVCFSFLALFIPNFVLPEWIPFVVGKFMTRLTSRVFLSVEMICIVLFIITNIISMSLWIAVQVQIAWNMNDELNNVLSSYNYDFSIGFHDSLSAPWNFLFKTAQCCGTRDYTSLQISYWYNNKRLSIDQQIPTTCCKYQPSSRFYSSNLTNECVNVDDNSTYYNTGCTSTLLTRLNYYNIPYFVFVAFIILTEILLIVLTDRVFKYLESSTSKDKNSEEQNVIENYGLFSRLGFYIANNRFINPQRMEGFRAIVIAFIIFNICSATICQVYGIGAMVIRFQSWMTDGVLDNLYSLTIEDQWLYNVAIGLMYTTFIYSIILLGVLIFGVVSILRLSKPLLIMHAVFVVLLIPFIVTMLGFLSHILRLVYDCVWANNNYQHVAETYNTDENTIMEVCRSGNVNIILAQSWVLFSFLVFNLAVVIVELIFIDRLYQRLNKTEEGNNLGKGMFKELWDKCFGRWINDTNMPGFTKIVTLFCLFNMIIMLVYLIFGIGAIRVRYLSWMDNIIIDLSKVYTEIFQLGELFSGLMITVFAVSVFIYAPMCMFGLIAVLRRSKILLSVLYGSLFLWIPINLIFLAFLSYFFRLVTNCRITTDYNTLAGTYHSYEKLSTAISQACRWTSINLVSRYAWVFFTYIILNFVIMIVLLILIDRIYLRINKSNQNNPVDIGLSALIWNKIFGRWINDEKMPGYTKIVTAFCILNIIGIPLHLIFSIGAVVIRNLNWMQTIISELSMVYTQGYQLGEMFSGVMIAVAVLSFFLHALTCVFGIFSVLRRSKRFSSVYGIVILFWIPVNIILLSFLTYIFSLVYDCKNTGNYGTNLADVYSTYESSLDTVLNNVCDSTIDLIERYAWTLFVYIVLNLAFVIVQLILIDRIYLRINRSDTDNPTEKGLFSLFWSKIFRRCINEDKMPGFMKIVDGYCIFNLCTMPVELFFGIGAVVLRYQPFMTEIVLPNLDDLFTGIFQLGGIALGLMLGACIFCIFHAVINILGIIVAIRLSRRFILVHGVINGVWILIDVVFIVFLSYMFHLAFDCSADDYQTSMLGTYNTYKPISEVLQANCRWHNRRILLIHSWALFSYIIFNLSSIVVTIILDVVLYRKITNIGSIHDSAGHELTDRS